MSNARLSTQSAALSSFPPPPPPLKHNNTGNDQAVLLHDATVTCYSSEHVQWILLAGVPMWLLYVIGLPVMAYFALRKSDCHGLLERWGKHDFNPSSLTAQDRITLTRFAFLFKGYRPQYYFW